MTATPTQRSLELLRSQGYQAAVVERWNAHAKIRQDLFGIIDILAVREGETLGVQTTSYSNMSARVKKITDSDILPVLRKAQWSIHVHGWRKSPNGRYVLHTADLT